jgi:Flp pilus assembly protein TadG
MLRRTTRTGRRGSILPMLAFAIVALCGFVALAVDLGLVMTAKTQAQNAADAAAMAGARSLDGSPSGNVTNATANAKKVAAANQVLASNVAEADVIVVAHGSYHYDVKNEVFVPQIPPVAPDNFNLTQVTVQRGNPTAFARVLGVGSFSVTATAIAAHRPRDVSIVLDFSGSMNNESDLWNNEGYLGGANNSPNNTDSVFPTWAHYSSGSATMQCTSSDKRVGRCNVTKKISGIPAMVDDLFQNARGASALKAFSSVPYTDLATPPSGDAYMKTKAGTGWATTVQEITGATSTDITNKKDPPMPAYTDFKGYTEGPGYYGRTFFIWPPYPEDPAAVSNPPKDWRRRFFLKTGGSHPTYGGQVDDNTKLWDGSGNWKDPNGNYVINYKAILAWIKEHCVQKSALDGRPFPPMMRAGRILFYDQIPDDVPAAAYSPTYRNYNITDSNQRFWKEYIDYTLGVWRDPFGNIQVPGKPSCSYGPDFTWGTVKISGPYGPYATAPTTRMHPQDNPKRPRHRFWFGPMTMVQFMSDTGLLPGTSHDISMVAAKLGIDGALKDIETNHPNDLVSMLLFSRPNFEGEPAAAGSFTFPQYTLSRDYKGMRDSLWFPPGSGTKDVRIWDTNDLMTPRAHGDYNGNTATSYGLMLAYNQFSGSKDLRDLNIGGKGRKGAQRLVILETDGMANVSATVGFTTAGTNSYYNLGPSDVIKAGTASPGTQATDVAKKICALTTDTANGPGFATPGRPVIIHCIGFGAVFEADAAGSDPANALKLLQDISAIGGTGFPASLTDPGDPYAYKLCTGTLTERQNKLRTAFSKIMDDGISVVMVR